VVNVEIQVWTLIGVVIAGGGIAMSVVFHAMGLLGSRIDSLGGRFDGLDRRVDALDTKIDALSNRMDVKFDLQSSRMDSLVAELGHVNLTLGELVGKAHTHDRVA